MLRVKLDVNGEDIGLLVITRDEKYIGDTVQYPYTYVFSSLENSRGFDPELTAGKVFHQFEDGALELVRLVLEDIRNPECPA